MIDDSGEPGAVGSKSITATEEADENATLRGTVPSCAILVSTMHLPKAFTFLARDAW